MRSLSALLAKLLMVSLLSIALPARAQENGRIEGRVLSADGEGVEGVKAVLDPLQRTVVTGDSGRFTFEDVPAGTYVLTFQLGDETVQEQGVAVTPGATVSLEKRVEGWHQFTDTVTVVSASRRRERIVEAPAAMTVVSPEEAARESSTGQLPKILEFTPGVEITQSGLYDFNLNLRGFNTSLNRRILVLMDGRDPSYPFLGTQEWAAVSFPLYDIERAELVRGPASALYGNDAFNGVLNITTLPPRESLGGRVDLTLGQLDTRRIDARYASRLGASTYLKLVGGYQRSDDFAHSRNVSVEYPGIPLEAVPLAKERSEVAFGGVRLDRYFGRSDSLATLEAGTANIEGVPILTNIGRVEVTDSRRPWGRLNINTLHWNFLASATTRDASGLVSLGSGAPLVLDEYRTAAELQGNVGFAGGRGRLVAGGSYGETSIDSENSQGRQTLLFERQIGQRVGAFAQADYAVTDKLKALAAARWDDSSFIEDSQFSPKAALVYSISRRHTLRLTYNEAFQSPNIAELFVQIPVAPPLDLSALEAALAPVLDGVPLGFANIPFLALGNEGLQVEKVRSSELGYSGLLGRRVYLTVDYYRSQVRHFVSTLLPQLGTSLGRVNPDFGPYRPPAALSPAASALVLGSLRSVLPPEVFALLSNNVDGSPIFAALSLTNVGQVDTQGIDLSAQVYMERGWSLQAGYSHLDFKVRKETAEHPILPNAPDNRAFLVLAYAQDAWDASIAGRWSDQFDWRGGLFIGPVPSYTVADLSAGRRLGNQWKASLNVANVFNERHYEIFGGDLLSRRALVSLSRTW